MWRCPPLLRLPPLPPPARDPQLSRAAVVTGASKQRRRPWRGWAQTRPPSRTFLSPVNMGRRVDARARQCTLAHGGAGLCVPYPLELHKYSHIPPASYICGLVSILIRVSATLLCVVFRVHAVSSISRASFFTQTHGKPGFTAFAHPFCISSPIRTTRSGAAG